MSQRDLPEECWELILNRIDHHSHFESLSLVSKQFLSLTNRLRRSLTIVDPTPSTQFPISDLLQRFPNLKVLDLTECHNNLDTILFEIAHSPVLRLESLNISNKIRFPLRGLVESGLSISNLRVLSCVNISLLGDGDLIKIARSFPMLEELDISYPEYCLSNDSTSDNEAYVTDVGVEALWSNVRNLRKINLSGNYFITDGSLVGLSLNCVLLRGVAVKDCALITRDGIEFMLRNSPDLSVISVRGIDILPASLRFIDTFICARALSSLDLCGSAISNDFLCAIAKACIPLKRVSFDHCTNFSFPGISFFLQVYQSLEYLALVNVHFLTDQHISDLSRYLSDLVAIKLNSCYKLTVTTLFTLAKNCSLLKDIKMERTSMRQFDCSLQCAKNFKIRSLKARYTHMTDECLEKIALLCPNLEMLDLRHCSRVTGEGISELLKSCPEIRHLMISDCGGIKSLGTGEGLLKLEVLCAARSGFNDEGLVTIGKRCCSLRELDLQGCVALTTTIKEVVNNCKRLRKINLKGCSGVVFPIADWMVSPSPSLKKVIPPCYDTISVNQRQLLLRHGCPVRRG
ncbi:hypothetical protein RJ640_021332 [Escallonia rubra]|uniref:Uncharacterized protein n=1 Tax=Escallonia rubra TaxID=112253 RepID=A0AA88R883_9ASTE|nr:hypothetical protein RJ640_021332 [Escallonia rubra]